MKYSVDTSALIQAWVSTYPLEHFPNLWLKIEGLIANGELRASEEVLHELERKTDDLYVWAHAHAAMFVSLDEPVQVEVQRILATHPKLIDTRRNRSGADPFVIALARLHGAAVITHEGRTNTPGRPQIPDVCHAVGVRSLGVLELIREKGWRF